MSGVNGTTHRGIVSTILVLASTAAHAQTMQGGALLENPLFQANTTTYFIGGLLLLLLVAFFVVQRRFLTTRRELKDMTSELDQTRHRLTETNHSLESTERTLKKTTARYQNMLFDARSGMFQIDLDGKCIYINNALQEMSGLYLKKAQTEGLQGAIHPDDRQRFSAAWEAFTKKDTAFDLKFRFKQAKGREVHVVCRASKVLNEKKEVESFMGWVTDISPLHNQQVEQEAITNRYAGFINKTVEGFYQLVPEQPIPVTSADTMAKSIMEGMRLASCNETFAAMYGTTAVDLRNKGINVIPGGCGPFKNIDDIKKFVTDRFSITNAESVRQDPRGNRLNLLNNVVGIVEDNKLVAIWGSQRNVSQLKREKAELASQATFMRRILDALPADVVVKDTRCRYLYASKKLASRTGIAQENWIGKTIFEVLPATPREHDKSAIEVMKSGKMSRVERSYEARGKSGWMETVQIPLVSDDGLVEGIVGLSLEITDRKKKEEELKHQLSQIEQQLRHRTSELQKSQGELSQTAVALRDSNQKLRIRDAELQNKAHTFSEQLKERDRVEEALRRNEDSLLTRQSQLEAELGKTREELSSESEKRRKWEELISIKEDELRKIETSHAERSKELDEVREIRRNLESELQARMKELDGAKADVSKTKESLKAEIDKQAVQHKKEFTEEHFARKQSEDKLKQVDEALRESQDKIKQLAEKHAAELEHEVSERKDATTKLIKATDELDTLKHQFEQRIEEETKLLKQDIAEKQIREKALRQHEKDLASRIKELEKTLNMKVHEHEEQLQAREGAEVGRKQAEQKLEQMTKRQKELVERETQRLNLSIAEIRLDEVKLRTEVGILQEAKEKLEDQLKARTVELDKANKLQTQTATTLSETKAKLDAVKKEQAAIVAKKTVAMQEELKQLKQTEADLRKQEALLQKQNAELEKKIVSLQEQVKNEQAGRKALEKELKELEQAFNAGQSNIDGLIKQETEKLQQQIDEYKKNIATRKQNEARLHQQVEQLNKSIDERGKELEAAHQDRQKAEKELADTLGRAGQSVKETEQMLANLKKEHEAEIQKVKDEGLEIQRREQHYRSIFQSSAQAFLQLDPITGGIKSANRSASTLFGLKSSDDWTKRTFSTLSPPSQPDESNSPDMAKTHLHTAMEQGHETFEWAFKKTDKETFHALVTLSVIGNEEKQHILAAIQDISAIKRQQATLREALEEAHAANQMNVAVVDEVDDTVQTSLAPVVDTSITLEQSENLTVEQKLEMAVINRNCRSLIDMMTYRRELSHLSDSGDDVVAKKCDLHQMIQNLDQQFTHRAKTKKLFFAISYAQYQSANNLPKMVETDEAKLNKIIGILLGYALEHTEKGRLGLHATSQSGSDNRLNIAFELTYTGKQAKDELLDRVFGSGGGGKADEKALKYGLATARRYAQLLGYSIKLDYREGETTALTITCPFKKAESGIVMLNEEDKAEAGAA